MYQQLVVSFSENPRDIATTSGLWFYVHTENGKLYVESGRSHVEKKSKITTPRKLKEDEFSEILSIYHRRQIREKVSKEASNATVNQSYWFGIFADMGL